MTTPSQRALFCCLLDHFYQDLDWDGEPEYAHKVRYEADNLIQVLGVTNKDAQEAESHWVVRYHFKAA